MTGSDIVGQISPFNIVIDGAPDKNGVFRIYEMQPADHSGSKGQLAVFGEDLLLERTFPFLENKFGTLWRKDGLDDDPLLSASIARQLDRTNNLPNVRWASFQGILLPLGIRRNSEVADLRNRYPNLTMPAQTGLICNAFFWKTVFAAILPQSLKPHMPDHEIMPRMTLSPLRKALIERFGADRDIIIKGATDVMGQSVGLINRAMLNDDTPHRNELSGINLSKLYNFLGHRRVDNHRVLRHLLSNGLLQKNADETVLVAQECIDPMLLRANDGLDYRATMRVHCTVWWDENGHGQVEYQGAYWKLPPESAQDQSTDMSVMSPRQKGRAYDKQFASVDPVLESEIFMQLETPLISAMEDFHAMNENPEPVILDLLRHSNRGHRLTGLWLASRWQDIAWGNETIFPDALSTAILNAARCDPVVGYVCRMISKDKHSHHGFEAAVTKKLDGNHIDSFQNAYHLTV